MSRPGNGSGAERSAGNRGVVVHAKGDLRLEDLPAPVPAADEAVVAIAYGGICGSDLHYWRDGAAGQSILREPMVLGHEVVGVVRTPAVDGSGPPPGTAVAVHPATPAAAGTVRWPSDRPNLSPGGSYLGSAARLPHTQGAFAELVALPTRMLRALPASLPMRTAALAEPAAVAWHAVARAGAVRGRSVLVIGAGPIGLLTVAVLRRAGADVTAVDLEDRALDLAVELGAERTLDARDEHAVAAVQADIAIEASGHPAGLAGAIAGTARGGRVVMVGLLPPGPQPVPVAAAISKELELVGSFRFNDEIDDVIAALADGSLAADPVITHEYDLADAVAAFTVAAAAGASSKVLLRFG